MTPKELHDLYAPLWAREPGTRPSSGTPRSSYSYTFELQENMDEFWFEFMNPLSGFGCGGIDDQAAAALCRVTVEDWLFRSCYGRWEIGARANFDGSEPTEFECGGFRGPTIHHALIAAAMAVLDARGKQPNEMTIEFVATKSRPATPEEKCQYGDQCKAVIEEAKVVNVYGPAMIPIVNGIPTAPVPQAPPRSSPNR